MIVLGEKVKDSLTGFEGVATARTEYLYGCVRICVESLELDKDGDPKEVWFDEQRLVELAKMAKMAKSVAKIGGPGGPVPPKRNTG
jgi:hypothetical protein